MLYQWGSRNLPLAPTPLEAKTQPATGRVVERHFVHRDFRDALTNAHLESVADYFRREDAKVLRRRDGRANVLLQLDLGAGTVTCFLKTHEPLQPLQGILQLLRARAGDTAGMQELRNVETLRAIGIDTVPVVAAGEETGSYRRRRSYFLSKKIDRARPLDDFLVDRFAGRTHLERRELRLKRKIIDLLARTARRFHAARCHHQDFYLNHFFIRLDGEPQLFLIDLQRMRRPRRLRRRWIVKDLGQLNHSADRAKLSKTDRLRFIMTYLNVSPLNRSDKRFIGSILRKSARIARHAGRGK